MKRSLTLFESHRILRVLGATALVWSSTVNVGLQAQDKKVFTHVADVKLGNDDAMLDVYKPISERFESEYRAIGTAFTVGEQLFAQKRYDDAIRNFETVITKAGKKYPFLADAARLRLSHTHLMNSYPTMALIKAREVANASNKFLAAESWYTLSRAYLAAGKIDRAEDA